MEQLSIDFFKYGIYCLTICFPIVTLESIGVYNDINFLFSLGFRSSGKTMKNINLNKLEELKNQKIITKDSIFRFDRTGKIYIRNLNQHSKKMGFRPNLRTIKGIAQITSQGQLKVQLYSFLGNTLMLIFLPIIWIAGIIGASYNPDGNAELGVITLIIGSILFIGSSFGEKKKFNKMCTELEEILNGKIETETKKATKK
jgi:hypothetical protein